MLVWILVTAVVALGGALVVLLIRFGKQRRELEHLRIRLGGAETRFRRLFESFPASVVLYDLSDRAVPWRIVECNRRASEMHGYTRAEMIGKGLALISSAGHTYEYAQARLEALRREGTREGEATHRRKDGSIIHTHYVATLIDVDGRELLIGIDLDITGRKVAEAALRASEERYRTIIRMSPESVVLFDAQDTVVPMRILECNERTCEMHGYTRDELIGQSNALIDTFSWTADAAKRELISLQDGGAKRGEATHRRKDGSVFPIEFSISRVTIQGYNYLLGFDRDITTRVRMREERIRLDTEVQRSRRMKAVGELAGGIAHEFNNLLTPMRVQAELIMRERPDDLDLANDIGVIRSAIDRARELVQRVLTVGRRVPSDGDSVDLHAAAEESLALIRASVDRRIRITLQPVTSVLHARMNRTDLNQALLNLVLNARDTLIDRLGKEVDTGWRPAVDIEIRPRVSPKPGCRAGARKSAGTDHAWHQISVRDNGLGIPPEALDRIFEPFFTTKDVGHGTGLGLATVWNIAEAAGGCMDVESKPGEGSVFSIYLPAHAPQEPSVQVEPVSVPAKVARAQRCVCVLLVDDEPAVSRVMGAVLRRMGHAVMEVSSGTAALDMDTTGIDLVITDLNMPVLNGMGLIRALRRKGFTAPIIACSGYTSTERIAELASCDVTTVLRKPFAIEQVAEALDACGIR